MVLAVGSMVVRGAFKAGSLLTGLAKTVTGLKQTESESKSTTVAMDRMRGTTKKLAGALALIGVGGFAALMMTAPQLAGALMRIKMLMKMIAWSIGRHLKPLLDAVGKILHGIRTGDWSMIISGIKDAWEAVKGLVATSIEWIKGVYNSIWEELEKRGIEKPQWLIDIENWLGEIERIVKEKDWDALWDWIIQPFKWVWNKFMETEMGGMVKKILEEVQKEEATITSIGVFIGKGILKGMKEALLGPVDDLLSMKKTRDKWRFFSGGKSGGEGFGGSWSEPDSQQVGGMIPTTGLYHMHAGEYVTPSGVSKSHSGGGDTTINLDFSGAKFELGGGIQVQDFAKVLSEQIAEAQRDVTY